MTETAGAPVVQALRVSAHLLHLEPGLFCLYREEAGAQAGWLPAVRLAPPPDSAGRVVVGGLGAGGWLGARDDAALVRVSGGAAALLVTIYQEANAAEAAPHLKVLRLSGSPAATAAGLIAHVYGQGDVAGQVGAWIGERGSRRWIEGFALTLPAPLAAGEVEYQAVLGRDWLSPWSEAGGFCGSRGMALPILGLSVRLLGAAAASHAVALSATFIDGSAAGPVGDGEACQSETLAPLEAFQLALVAREAKVGRRKR